MYVKLVIEVNEGNNNVIAQSNASQLMLWSYDFVNGFAVAENVWYPEDVEWRQFWESQYSTVAFQTDLRKQVGRTY